MTLKIIISCISFLWAFSLFATVPDVLKIPAPRSNFDLSVDYHQTLLTMALTAGANGRKVPKVEMIYNMSQARAKYELMKGKLIDVYWLGTSIQEEKDLSAIRIPTTRGLIGFRKFLINKKSKAAFDTIKNLDDLKQFVACQGKHWPDTEILEKAGLKVIATPTYENLFSMLNAGRCDYFPRGFHDAGNDVVIRQSKFPDLMSYSRILLHYPFAVYFFTKKESTELTKWIEDGMTILAETGQIEALMQKHALTAHIYPLSKDQTQLYLQLKNPLLPADTDYKNPLFWYQNGVFKADSSLNKISFSK
ncbi:transporter substrate-binding domain-containing protein [Catenovulum sp. 2E275]|uniref:transporter substrate-binding domain-containing protein n=1 Tax=Catenovulum sp. 2E275 TaxID=2980497 RepID=UPI0021CE80A3|nr:transporter substrate-binding domain-containing protein [Catenovulum sp. 2E275]MCU4674111.1 transporter substrate-binding domain-containing protein [Catenovulum sp. 2E275]